MQQPIHLLASALFNIRTNLAALRTQRTTEGREHFIINVKVFSKTIKELYSKCQLSAQNICRSFEISYLSVELRTVALYTLTMKAQSNENGILLR